MIEFKLSKSLGLFTLLVESSFRKIRTFSHELEQLEVAVHRWAVDRDVVL